MHIFWMSEQEQLFIVNMEIKKNTLIRIIYGQVFINKMCQQKFT